MTLPLSEIELLNLGEVDAEGRLVATIIFDPDDRRAAYRELLERHARSESGRVMPGELFELRRALLDGDSGDRGARQPHDGNQCRNASPRCEGLRDGRVGLSTTTAPVVDSVRVRV